MIEIVAMMKVRDRALFHEFESEAAKIMQRYGGEIISAFEPSEELSKGRDFDEVHILRFPSEQAFADYRGDAALMELADLREQAIAETEVYVSGKRVNY